MSHRRRYLRRQGVSLEHSGGGLSFSRTTSGLLFREQFPTNGESVPGWTDDDGAAGNDWQVVNNVLISLGTYLFRDIGASWGASFILQWNEDFASAADSNQMIFKGTSITDAALGTDFYQFINRQAANDSRLFDGTVQDTETTNIVLDEIFGFRLIADNNGSQTVFTGLQTTALSVITDVTETFGAMGNGLTFTDTSPRTGTQMALVNVTLQEWDEIMLFGTTITCTNMKSGWKFRIGSEAVQTESSGTATYALSDIQALAFPITTVDLIDPNDNVKKTLTPSGGVFGGDVYQMN